MIPLSEEASFQPVFFFHLVDTFHQFESQISDKQPRLQSWSRIHTAHAFRLILTYTAANVPDESIPLEQPGPEPNTARKQTFARMLPAVSESVSLG